MRHITPLKSYQNAYSFWVCVLLGGLYKLQLSLLHASLLNGLTMH